MKNSDLKNSDLKNIIRCGDCKYSEAVSIEPNKQLNCLMQRGDPEWNQKHSLVYAYQFCDEGESREVNQ